MLPLLVPHMTLCDTSLAGHKIPKGTNIWGNVWGLHHNKEIWGDPDVFRPERYLDEKGNLVPADHPARVCNLTFGAGPRVCPGETFAMTRMFILLACMMKNFEFLTPKGQKMFDVRNITNGIVLASQPYKVILKVRNSDTP